MKISFKFKEEIWGQTSGERKRIPILVALVPKSLKEIGQTSGKRKRTVKPELAFLRRQAKNCDILFIKGKFC